MTDKPQTTNDFIPAYEGNDMAGYMMSVGFRLPQEYVEHIYSITNVRDTAIIVTDWSVWISKPKAKTGFCIELMERYR